MRRYALSVRSAADLCLFLRSEKDSLLSFSGGDTWIKVDLTQNQRGHSCGWRSRKTAMKCKMLTVEAWSINRWIVIQSISPSRNALFFTRTTGTWLPHTPFILVHWSGLTCYGNRSWWGCTWLLIHSTSLPHANPFPVQITQSLHFLLISTFIWYHILFPIESQSPGAAALPLSHMQWDGICFLVYNPYQLIETVKRVSLSLLVTQSYPDACEHCRIIWLVSAQTSGLFPF